jgi:hypothetical protein
LYFRALHVLTVRFTRPISPHPSRNT